MAEVSSYSTDPAATRSTMIYPLGVVLALSSLVVLLLIIPPFCWHLKNRNIGATFFVGWAGLLLLFNFINAVLWDTDDIKSWYNGVGLCDIEVKFQLAYEVGLPAAFWCVLRDLAAIMDTTQTGFVKTEAQKRRGLVVDLIICALVPLLQMPLHFIVQSNRYWLVGIAGCQFTAEYSWLTIVLLLVPSGCLLTLDGYFAVLIIIRLYRYRLEFGSILASNNTTKSRFLRLYLLCITWLIASTGVWIFTLWVYYEHVNPGFSWSKTHNPATWNTIVMFPSHGQVSYDRWVWLLTGVLIFVFFGFGKEAKDMYRAPFISMGLGKIFPCLIRNVNSNQNNRSVLTNESVASKTLAFFKRKGTGLSTPSSSPSTGTKDFAEPLHSPSCAAPCHLAETAPSHSPPRFPFLTRLLWRFIPLGRGQDSNDNQARGAPPAVVTGNSPTVRSTVSVDHPHATTHSIDDIVVSPGEVVVKKQVTRESQDV